MIIEAYIKESAPQVDGRIYITEVQVDDRLGELRFVYLLDEDSPPAEQIMKERMAALNEAGADVPIDQLPADPIDAISVLDLAPALQDVATAYKELSAKDREAFKALL